MNDLFRLFRKLKKNMFELNVGLNRLTAAYRAEPSFMIIGAQKGGTTSLHHYLCQNPNIKSALKKEVHFFNQFKQRDISWYKAYFPIKRSKKSKLYLDATPQYLPHPFVPERIAQHYPGMKFIVLLRNPIDRAYSHFQHQVRNHREKGTFDQAISAMVIENHENLYEKSLKDINDQEQIDYFLNYVNRGKYVYQLEHWFRYFPRDQFLIMNSEYFYQHPVDALKQCSEFVGVNYWKGTKFEVRNSSGAYEKMNPVTRQQLAEYYRPYNEKLFQLLGVDYGWNKF